MGLVKWADKRIGGIGFWDVQAIKISVLGFALMIAKLWEPVLSLEWYWYALIFVIFAVKPLSKVLSK